MAVPSKHKRVSVAAGKSTDVAAKDEGRRKFPYLYRGRPCPRDFFHAGSVFFPTPRGFSAAAR
ncbi:MAG: hypothetical protein AVDCRST_MAG56-4925 [uncultured Cytophagales bacterium]|uniref:Uncharacterized protein n=1 Tax=uncultured Cytophagales bacterium TaxID=158755 RepID=A0A6J4JN08_9SPHI|nr:MAG: hypothetical protein AVDCRST_MAG56-4925 [uncultured Cytophagales bacterium]